VPTTGANLERPLRVKAAYGPYNLFRFEHRFEAVTTQREPGQPDQRPTPTGRLASRTNPHP
jgi:hypothetical protein